MSRNKIADRYAKALYLLAEERGEIEAVETDMEAISRILGDRVDLREILSDPTWTQGVKKTLMEKIFVEIKRSIRDLFGLLEIKNRIELLGEISLSFREITRIRKGIEEGTVVSAREIDASQVEKIALVLKAKRGKIFRLSTRVDPSLKGGFQVILGDRIYDYSLRGYLEQLAIQMGGVAYNHN